MKTEIITIGEEILIGQVVDTNSAFIGEKLNLAGIRVNRITSVTDECEGIMQALHEANERADLVLITGGLGPTKDDITKPVFCDYFSTRLVFNDRAFENIKKIFRNRNFEMNELNRRQAEVPENCTVIPNHEGTASGMWFEKDGTIFISMPGVPFEMETMIVREIIPRLKSRFQLPVIAQKTVNTQGAYEGLLAETLEEWERGLAEQGISLAYLPSPGIIRLRLTATGTDSLALEQRIDNEIEKLEHIIPGKIFGFNDDTLHSVIGRLLTEQEKTLAVAESCTGGHIGHLVTSVPGSSGYFKGGIIAYSNEAKENLLGVSTAKLGQFGAVSREVVEEMASGVRKMFDADYAIATSGIAGPSGGTDVKPVGLTWIAVASCNK
ncbi:MAG: competence/damage-inducible protein A, partial [Bacteroidetes bacterium]|nr:competence/damage-inducible protein A [Bacteroidota bacterium]